MAITAVFTCGFECGLVTTGALALNQHWSIAGASVSVSTSTVRSGTRSLRINPTAANGNVTSPSVHSSATRHVVRFYVYFATLPSVDISLCVSVSDFLGPQVRFKQSDSKIYAAVGTTFGASGVAVTTGVWYRIDADFNINTGGADFCDVQVDGTVCGQATATGTSSSGITDLLGTATSFTGDLFFDDFVSSSTAADYPIGAGYVDAFVPTADGTHNVAGAADFRRTLTATDILNSTTDAYQLIDDVPLESGASVDWINLVAPPNATDYVECVFGPAPGVSTPTAAPRAVEVVTGYHQAATGVGNMAILMNDNGTTDVLYTATGVAGVTSVAYKRKFYATAPTGGAWVIGGGGDGDFTDLRVRFGSPAAVDANPDQYFDCIMVEAEFAAAVEKPPPSVFVRQAVRRASYW